MSKLLQPIVEFLIPTLLVLLALLALLSSIWIVLGRD
jgi:hypothetical protein